MLKFISHNHLRTYGHSEQLLKLAKEIISFLQKKPSIESPQTPKFLLEILSKEQKLINNGDVDDWRLLINIAHTYLLNFDQWASQTSLGQTGIRLKLWKSLQLLHYRAYLSQYGFCGYPYVILTSIYNKSLQIINKLFLPKSKPSELAKQPTVEIQLAKQKNNLPIVSLIMPMYNMANYVEEALKSAILQNYPNLQIIVVNDNSQDASLTIVNNLINQYPQHNITVISHSQNYGVGAARNTGIAQAKGEYIIFLDADDWISPNYIQNLVQFALANDLKMLLGEVRTWTNSLAQAKADNPYFIPETLRNNPEKNWYIYRRTNAKTQTNDLFYANLWKLPDMAGAKLIHRTIFDNLRFPEQVIHEDFGFFIVALSILPSIGYYRDNKNFYAYRQHKNSIINQKNNQGEKALDIIPVLNYIETTIAKLAPIHKTDARKINIKWLHTEIIRQLKFPQLSHKFSQQLWQLIHKTPNELCKSYWGKTEGINNYLKAKTQPKAIIFWRIWKEIWQIQGLR